MKNIVFVSEKGGVGKTRFIALKEQLFMWMLYIINFKTMKIFL